MGSSILSDGGTNSMGWVPKHRLPLCFLRIQSDQLPHTPPAMTSLHDGLYPQTVSGNPPLFPSITFIRGLDTAVQKRTKAEPSESMNFSKPVCWPDTTLTVWYGRHSDSNYNMETEEQRSLIQHTKLRLTGMTDANNKIRIRKDQGMGRVPMLSQSRKLF